MDDMRDRITEALDGVVHDLDASRFLADAVREVVGPELERLRAYIAEMEAEPEGGEDEPPTDPAELREMWAFICREARWKHRLVVKRGQRAERAEGERDALKATLADVAEVTRRARRIMTGSSRDWSLHADDAWLYALLVGWDCEMAEHADGSHDPIDCSGPARLEDFAERFGWTEGGIAKLRAQRQVIAALDQPADQPIAPPPRRLTEQQGGIPNDAITPDDMRRRHDQTRGDE